MKIQKIVAGLLFLTVFVVVPSLGFSQISSGADAIVPTEYTGSPQDFIHIFCGEKGALNASLTATNPTTESATFEWQKYNEVSGNFEFFSSDLSGNKTSTLSSLADGCYRVNIAGASGVKTYTAWVFNNYITSSGTITDSDCNSFTLNGAFETPDLKYVDLSNKQARVLNKDIKVKWAEGNTIVSKVIKSKVYSPPTKDTDYTLEVSDKFGCVSKSVVRYISIVTKASFDYKLEDQKSHPSKKEAPLTVTFNNTSENGDSGKYQWFIFRDVDEMKREAKANQGKVKDSIMAKILSDNPIYVFERPGSYKVKLVSQKKSEYTTCFDTVYIKDYITIDTSFIEAPNFFSPNGDDANQKFTIRFFSMKSVKISIFDRWGKMMHQWESNNVQGFGPTVETIPQAVWDGKVGGKVATPGVYYYIVEGIGRDDKRRRTSGFVHLFRGK